MDVLHRKVVARIREVAKQQGIPITHLPDRAGVAKSHFFNVLRGVNSPTLGWLSKLAKALGVEPTELVRFDRAEPTKPRRPK